MKIDITKAASFVKAGAIEAMEPQVKAAQKALEEGTCAGNDFLGWMHLPSSRWDHGSMMSLDYGTNVI